MWQIEMRNGYAVLSKNAPMINPNPKQMTLCEKNGGMEDDSEIPDRSALSIVEV